ncbi:hypothetical protein IW140_005918 [Coemansia sp. RSA 1813]|nr:hypothetical protein EV178_005908 [Coemansia sp. RSA 1646]KAJ1767670.1 hypothetical protein LPJ74_005235 [Coemansia sp. RSA 1843]KAJ2086227.1 hypothetical protein IW138_005820 [Coemansia sp. RSA 986]KAJ2214907.1 hypothetical protein EV179_002582 [Coemansia sp. RSA 487]KAJ2563956.1 hypothetical protein IW140_005918 [Coemansia sp. RSA 1813]
MRTLGALAFSAFAVFAAMAKCYPTTSSGGSAVPSSSTEFWFSQPIDHFGLNNDTWDQRYLFNATFYKPGGPIIMATPGEAAVSSSLADLSHFNYLAQLTDGLVVLVEHRFYGKSNPMPDLSGDSLKYHTVENVLQDFAEFIRAAKSNPDQIFSLPVSRNSKVVFGGGSYAGSIAAWIRAKYPDLVAGAWASSAVIKYRLENYQFDQSWGKHLEALGCAQDVATAVEDLDSILLSGNTTAFSELQSKFSFPALSPSDFAALANVFINSAAMAPTTKSGDYTESTVCAYFDGTRSPLDSYAAAVAKVVSAGGYTQDSLIQMGDTSLGYENYALGQSSRVWYYQECAWYGNWQVAPPSSTNMQRYRSQLVNLSYFQPNCRNKFGSDIQIPANSGGFDDKWLGMLRGTTNIYYTVGAYDIWRNSNVLSWDGYVLQNTTQSPIFLIDKATHSQDVAGHRVNDLDSVNLAREIGNRLVQQWIG